MFYIHRISTRGAAGLKTWCVRGHALPDRWKALNTAYMYDALAGTNRFYKKLPFSWAAIE